MPTPIPKDDCWPSMMLPEDYAESTWCYITVTFKNQDDETNGHGPLLLSVVYPACSGHRNNLLSAFCSIIVEIHEDKDKHIWITLSCYHSKTKGSKGNIQGAVPRWQRNRIGGHFLPHKFIKNSFEC